MKKIALLVAVLVGVFAGSVTSYAGTWSKDGEEWIYLQDDGTRATGLIEVNGKKYFLEPDHGWMVTSWWPIDGKWYYFRSDEGSMVCGQNYYGYYYDETGAYSPSVPTVENPGDLGHNHYKGLTEEQAKEADLHAQLRASMILNDPSITTDTDRVKAAYEMTCQALGNAGYEEAGDLDYRSPYGVFVSHEWSCAGAVRACGRILDFMGIPWEHANENQNVHQYAIVRVDGRTLRVDPQAHLFFEMAH